VIEDEQPPAAVIAADLRAGQVYRATGLFTVRLVAEKGAGTGMCIKNTRIQKKDPPTGINTDGISSPV
jgi:hypothetical protein